MKRQLLSWRWLLTTLLVLFGVGLTIRLGIWQLDRLAQRRIFNTRVLAQIDQPVTILNDNLDADLYDMEYRSVQVSGVYDPSQEVLLRNQVWEDRPGYHLLTPLILDGSDQAVLVDRGWIPLEEGEHLGQYAQTGDVSLQGVIRRPQARPDFGGVPDPTLAPGQARLNDWNIVNLDRIRQQVDVPMLPVYIERMPDGVNDDQMPYAAPLEIDLSEGPHLGYAIQWFIFAAILGLGYPFYIKHQLGRMPSGEDTKTPDRMDPKDSEMPKGRVEPK